MPSQATAIPEKLPSQTPAKDIPNRLTVVDHVYYRQTGQPIYHHESKYTVDLCNKEHPVYEQRMRAGEEWKPLNVNWMDFDGNPITECSLLIIRNEEGRFPHKIPSDQERQEAQEKVLEVTVGALTDPIWVVAPNTDARSQHCCAFDKTFIRCRKGTALFTLILIPA